MFSLVNRPRLELGSFRKLRFWASGLGLFRAKIPGRVLHGVSSWCSVALCCILLRINPCWAARATASRRCYTAPLFRFHVASRTFCWIGVTWTEPAWIAYGGG